MSETRFFSKHHWIFIRDVQDILGWHRSKVRRWVDQGKLPFLRDQNGYARFRRDDIERLAEQLGRVVHGAPAKVAAKAFKWFAQGKTWQEVLILFSEDGDPQPVGVVKTLYAEFLDEGRRDSTSGIVRRGNRRSSEPTLDDEEGATDDEEALAPTMDADAWRRDQEKQARRAQEELEREERAWEEEMRRQAEERAQRYPAFYKSHTLPAPSADEPAPISDRLVMLLQLVAAQKASGR